MTVLISWNDSQHTAGIYINNTYSRIISTIILVICIQLIILTVLYTDSKANIIYFLSNLLYLC